MDQHLSQAQLETLVEGKKHKPNATFFDKSTLDVDASNAAGRRVYKTLTYVKMTQNSVKDWVAVRATKQYIADYPDEYRYYLNNRDGVRSPSVDIIPNISPAEAEELIDFGIMTIDKLVQAETLPPHLEHLQKPARVLKAALMEISHVEESPEEKSVIQTQPRQETGEASDVYAADRPEHGDDVGRSTIPSSHESEGGKTPERIQEGGRLYGSEGLLSPNWSLSIG